MNARDLLNKVQEFKRLLEEHYKVWSNSLDDTIPDSPVRNTDLLDKQEKQLFKLLYQIDDYIDLFSKGRTMYYPMTGLTWDIYRTAIGNDVAQAKGPSMRNAILELEGIIGILENTDPEKEIRPNLIAAEDKRIFISHGKDSKALRKLERFLRGLGLIPIIVKDEPSRGRAVDDLVEEQMANCISAIILATKDDKVSDRGRKGRYFQPRPNVIHEIGLAQEKLKENVIYLKEIGCNFPSNINPKVWENFTQDNMEDAFLKITKELRAFGIIQ